MEAYRKKPARTIRKQATLKQLQLQVPQVNCLADALEDMGSIVRWPGHPISSRTRGYRLISSQFHHNWGDSRDNHLKTITDGHHRDEGQGQVVTMGRLKLS